MRTAPGALFLVVSATSMVGATPAQTSTTVPGTQTEVVRIDAVVTDGKGKLVTDLKAEDFKISEDGKAQKVTQFVVAGRPTTPAEPEPEAEPSVGVEVTPESEGGAPPAEETRGPGRQIVIVVDDLHIARGNIDFTREALRRVVQEFFAPEDKVALVMTSGTPGVPRLTEDRATLVQAVNRLTLRDITAIQAKITDMTPEQAELVLRGDMNAIKYTARTISQEAGSPYGTDSPLAQMVTTGTPVPAGLERNEVPAAEEAKRQARAILAGALHYSVATLATVESVLRSLEPLPGRKLCLLVSDGFLVGAGTSEERVREMRSVVDAATKSGAVVYTLDAGGLMTGARDASAPIGTGSLPDLEHGMNRDTAQLLRTTLETVSGDTGGFLVHGTNDLAGGLNRMLQDNETYYLLAYEPTNSKKDGKFRKIEVKIAQHNDFTVRTRRGYFAPDGRKMAASHGTPGSLALPPPVALPHVLDEGEARALLSASLPAGGGIPVALAADYLDLPRDGAKAIVRTQLDVGRMQWQKTNGRYRAALDLVGGLYDADGKAIGEPFAKHAEMDLSSADFKKLGEDGLPYQIVLPISPGRYQVRVVAHESKFDETGGAARWLEVPDLSSKKLAMSSLFLSTPSDKNSANPQASLRDMQALRRFGRNGSLYFQTYIYNAQADDKGARDVVLQAQIWSGTDMVAASKPQPPRFQEKNGAPAPETNGMSLQGLKPGAYELKVVVVDHLAGAEVSRTIDFTIE
jgi:VWFA-related protein